MEKQIKKLKKGWYNMVLSQPLKGCENSNIQYIIEVDGIYGVASQNPMTLDEINNINLSDWKFKPFREVMENKGVKK